VKKNDLQEEQLTTDDEQNESVRNQKNAEIVPPDQEKDIEGLQEAKDKYLRLYAEFENYKRRINKDKEELLRYGNEALIYELLPVIDNLEMALQHASDEEASSGLVQGVEITLRELMKALEKFGLSPIEADGKPFDPSVHHAMSQVVREDVNEEIVVEEFRKGYLLKEKVLRPSLVAVSKKPAQIGKAEKDKDTKEIKIKHIIEEET
jgi:molecular chaperone GrpE